MMSRVLRCVLHGFPPLGPGASRPHSLDLRNTCSPPRSTTALSRLVGLALALVSGVPALAAPPNVVMIISDDQGFGDFSFMGHPQIRTPHLDRLSSQSLTFRRGYVPSSLCSPSLASILTGLYPHQHKVTSNDPPLPAGKVGRAALQDSGYRAARNEMIANFDRSPTLPKALATRNYQSFQAGKWWGGNYRHGGFTDGMTQGDPDKGGRHGDEGLRIGRQGMTEVFEFIDKAGRQKAPFFLWYAPMMPHSPHTPPARLLEKYKGAAPSLEVAKYWAMCEWFDETCGQLLEHLDKNGLADDTMVVFVTDNGWIQDPDADRFAPRSKQSPNEGGIRTPILIRWPGHVEPRVSDQPVLSIDLAPTILGAAGLRPTAEMQGLNLLDNDAVERRKAIFGEIFTHNAVDIRDPASSLRSRWAIEGDWKLILPAPRNSPDATVELYDLAHDPGETTNLAARHPEKVDHLTTLINAWWPAKETSVTE
jgi:arylsulfatase A-like enzyme